ncbi:uncharacterized protein VTP21DRAFT_1173 [Calcarisporiella thermophila]|uniref:uncharacterized protein n=1 Tax=Calcarisporiella thermophila TaxID=911321 RepID=UPI0037430CEA
MQMYSRFNTRHARTLLPKPKNIATIYFRRHKATSSRRFGFAFDIDGVLLKGDRVLPEAKKVLRGLSGESSGRRRIPFILLTNGGGVTEEEKASELSEKLGIRISPSELVLSHSPMCQLASDFRNKNVLVVGGAGRACQTVAKKYGFDRVIVPDDILANDPSIWPFKKLPYDEIEQARKIDFTREPIEAVMMFHDSRDWGRDLQIVTDVLVSEGGVVGTRREDLSKQEIPLFFSNPDIIWSNNFPLPRLAQGSFRLALKTIYKDLTGQELKYTLFGKPERTTYQYAEKLLNEHSKFIYGQTIESGRVYAVGDNPAADIAGANAYGWTSILVRTGVFQGPENKSEHQADFIAEHVEEGVRWALSREGMSL